MKLTVINKLGKSAGSVELDDKISNSKFSDKLLAQAIRVNLSNLRQPIAKTKTRSEVSGGGRKPFKQKGTGRARAGSTRSPLWRGGGIIFGPTGQQNHQLKFPQKSNQKVIFSILSEKIKQKKLIVLDKFEILEYKTKLIENTLQNLPLEENSTIILILAEKDEKIIKSSANLAYLKTILVTNLNILDLLKYDYLIFSKAAIERLNKTYSESNVKSKKITSEVKPKAKSKAKK